MSSTKKARPGPKKGEGTALVYTTLRNRILTVSLPPGSNLSEPDIVKELGVSRTPVREAIGRLVAEGLVEVMPNQGARVTSTDISSTSELLEALELCQRAVTRWAALNRSEDQLDEIRAAGDVFKAAAKRLEFDRMGDLNREFHSAIAAASGNSIIADLYESLLGKSLRLARIILSRRLTFLDPADRYKVVISEHDAIVDAIAAQDADRAEQLAGQHTELFRKSIITYLTSRRSEKLTVPDRRDLAAEADALSD